MVRGLRVSSAAACVTEVLRGDATRHWLVSDVASRLRGRVQMTTDGHKLYLSAVEGAFGADIDFAT